MGCDAALAAAAARLASFGQLLREAPTDDFTRPARRCVRGALGNEPTRAYGCPAAGDDSRLTPVRTCQARLNSFCSALQALQFFCAKPPTRRARPPTLPGASYGLRGSLPLRPGLGTMRRAPSLASPPPALRLPRARDRAAAPSISSARERSPARLDAMGEPRAARRAREAARRKSAPETLAALRLPQAVATTLAPVRHIPKLPTRNFAPNTLSPMACTAPGELLACAAPAPPSVASPPAAHVAAQRPSSARPGHRGGGRRSRPDRSPSGGARPRSAPRSGRRRSDTDLIFVDDARRPSWAEAMLEARTAAPPSFAAAPERAPRRLGPLEPLHANPRAQARPSTPEKLVLRRPRQLAAVY